MLVPLRRTSMKRCCCAVISGCSSVALIGCLFKHAHGLFRRFHRLVGGCQLLATRLLTCAIGEHLQIAAKSAIVLFVCTLCAMVEQIRIIHRQCHPPARLSTANSASGGVYVGSGKGCPGVSTFTLTISSGVMVRSY